MTETMRKMLDLFVSKDQTRPHIATPWIANGWACATDGHCFIRIRCEGPDAPAEEDRPRPDLIFQGLKGRIPVAAIGINGRYLARLGGVQQFESRGRPEIEARRPGESVRDYKTRKAAWYAESGWEMSCGGALDPIHFTLVPGRHIEVLIMPRRV